MRWGRIIAGGFIAEVLLIIVAIPVIRVRRPDDAELDRRDRIGRHVIRGAPSGCARRVDSRFVLHGALTGLTAAVIYVALIVASRTDAAADLLGRARAQDCRRCRRRPVRRATHRQATSVTRAEARAGK